MRVVSKSQAGPKQKQGRGLANEETFTISRFIRQRKLRPQTQCWVDKGYAFSGENHFTAQPFNRL